VEWLEFDGDREAQCPGLLAERSHGLHPQPPLLGRGNHFPLPDILPEHQKQVRTAEFPGEIEVGPHPIDVKPPDGGTEIDEPQGHAAEAHHRQADLATGLADQPPFGRIDLERIGQNVDELEADPPGLGQSEPCPAAGLRERRIDQSQPHAKLPNRAEAA